MSRGIIFLILVLFFISGIPFCWATDVINITPTPQNLIYKNFNIKINSDWKIVIAKEDRGAYSIAKYLIDELSNRFDLAIGIQNISSATQRFKKSITLDLTDTQLSKEGYELEIFEDRILITANKPAGLFYGIQTFLQLVKSKGGQIKIPAVKIIDYPKIKKRGVHILGTNPTKIKNLLEQMAKFKMNMAIFQTGSYFELDKANNRQNFEEIFSYARERFIEPIPELSSFGVGADVLNKDPYAAEGIWVEDEHFKFVNDEAIPLRPTKYTLVNVIRSEDSNIIVENLGKTKTYEEKVDYKVIEGDVSYPYSLNNRPTKILRIPSGGIKNSEEVLISYDYVERKSPDAEWSIPYCPSSERTYKIMFEALRDVIETLNPSYISIGHDEIRGLNRDSRCKNRHLTNAELLADEINRLNDFVKSIDPNIRLLMWDDMMNPWHNGGDEDYQVQFGGVPGKTSDAIGLIPKDMIIMVWWYDANDWVNKMRHSPNFFESEDFDYIVAGYKDRKNIKDWLELIENKNKCLGIITTTWDGWQRNMDGIRYTAEMAWH